MRKFLAAASMVRVPRMIMLTLSVIAAISATPRAEARWSVNPTVTVSAPAGDTRISPVVGAVDFWNRQLADLGSPLRLGPVTHTIREFPLAYLEQLSVSVLEQRPRPAVPDVVAATPGHVIVAFTEGNFADAGGLLAYGPDTLDQWRRAGALVAKILKGARPAELPFEQVDRFRLIVNLRTAKALDLTIPQSILVRADKIIQ